MNVTAMLELSDGSVAIVDSQDLSLVSSYAWSLPRSSASRYPVGSRADLGAAETVFLHRLIAEAGPEDIVIHLNHDTLDNRRENLAVMGRVGIPGHVHVEPSAELFAD